MKQKRNKRETELQQNVLPAETNALGHATGLFNASDSLPATWMAGLEALENDFSDYSRDGTSLSQRRVFRSLVSCLKNQSVQSGSNGASESTDLPIITGIKIRYIDLLDNIANQQYGFPPPQRPKEIPALYRRRLILTVKPHVHRINSVLRSKLGISFRGVRDHYRLIWETPRTTIPKPTKILRMAESISKALAKKCPKTKAILLSLSSKKPSSLEIGETLKLKLQSPLTGYLTLAVFAHNQSQYLVPPTTGFSFSIDANKQYELPSALSMDPATAWPIEGCAGIHIVMAFVSPIHSRILFPPEINMTIHRDRSVGLCARDLRSLSLCDTAFGVIEFVVLPKRNSSSRVS